MDREGFKNRLKQYKQAREENPGLKYWEWKNIPKYDEGGKVIPTQEEYIAEQIAARKAAALEKSLSRTIPRVPQGIKTGERWNPVTKKVEDIYECGPSCAYTFSDNYGQNWMGSEDFKQNHANYGWRQIPWESRQPGDAVLIVDDKGTARHTMMYDSDNAQGKPLFNHSNGGRDESAIRKKAKYPHHNPYLIYEFVGTPADSTQWINDYKKIYGFADGGEVTDPIENPVLPQSHDPYFTQWQANWLNNRREQLYENMESSKNVAWASNISDAGWKDGSNNRSYLSNFSLAPLLKGMSPNRVWVNKEYYRQLNNAASAPEAFIPQFSGTSGAYIPGDHKIEYDPFLEEKQLRSIKMHERTHSSNPRPQEYKIRKITKWSENEKGYGPGMRYFKDPREIYARLMQYRHDNGLQPTDVITKEYLENHRQQLKDNWFHIFTDEELLDIFNNVAENRMDEKNTHKSMRA